MQLIGGHSGLRWQPAPNDGQKFSDETPQRIDNAHLRNFVLGILQHPQPAAYLDLLIRTIDRALNNIIPAARPAAAPGFLIGRPLALVRLSLNLELKGPPAFDQGWTSFVQDAAGNADQPRTTRGFTKVQVAVQLGDLEQAADGLVGYFREGGKGPADYAVFYSPAAKGAPEPNDSPDVRLPQTAPILLEADPASPPVLVTALMDPHAELHASTGLLPVKSITIPPDQYHDAVARLQISCLASPVVTPADALSLPLSRYAGFRWSFMECSGDVWHETGDIRAADDRSASKPQRINEGWLKLTPTQEDRQ